MLNRQIKRLIVTGIVCTVFSWGIPIRSQEVTAEEPQAEEVQTDNQKSPDATEAITAKDPKIPVDELLLLLKPLTRSQIEHEAEAWQLVLQEKVQEISDTEIAIKYPSRALKRQREAAALEAAEKAEQAQKSQLNRAKRALKRAQEKRGIIDTSSSEYKDITAQIERLEIAIDNFEDIQEIKAYTEPDTPEYGKVTQQLEAAQNSLKQATEAIEGAKTTPSNSTEQSSRHLNQGVTVLENTVREGNIEIIVASSVEGLYNLQIFSQKLDESEGADKSEYKRLLINKVTQLQAERAAIIERFETVLNELEIKGGEVKAYREYIQAVSSLTINLQDAEGLSTRLIVWLTSPEGGIRWAFRLIVFATIVTASVFISRILARIVNKTLLSFGDTSDLFRDFVVMLVQRGGIVIGCLIGLTTLGVSLGPMLALVGGTSFILAFALQSNLSNLASGLMLMVYKPFDTGDEVIIGDLWGFVDSITLASTKIKGWKSEMITMPNDTVWSSIIQNLTAEETRDGRIEIPVAFNQSISEVEKILVEIGESHPLALTARTLVWEYGEYCVTIHFFFVSKTSDFWTVWADLHRMIQQRFEQEGMSIALPTAIEIGFEADSQMPQPVVDSFNKLVKPQS